VPHECEVLLQVGGDEAFEAGESIDLHSDGAPRLEAVIKQFKLDRKKVMWGVSADVVHTPSAKEMRDSGRSEEQIGLLGPPEKFTTLSSLQTPEMGRVHQRFASHENGGIFIH
jgi:hypothetical protein